MLSADVIERIIRLDRNANQLVLPLNVLRCDESLGFLNNFSQRSAPVLKWGKLE